MRYFACLVSMVLIFAMGMYALVAIGTGTASTPSTAVAAFVDSVKLGGASVEDGGSRFYVKDSHKLISRTVIYVVVDRETGVEYALSLGNGGGMCPLYNQDGTLRVDEQFLEATQ